MGKKFGSVGKVTHRHSRDGRPGSRKKTFFLSFHGLPANPAEGGKSSFLSSTSY